MNDDLISRQVALDALFHNQEVYIKNFPDDPMAKYTVAIIDNDALTIAQLQPADVVEIVRCKDCVHWDSECDPPQYEGSNFCYINESRTKSTDFCSHGERKDDE